jgi:hypothetical protein
MPPGEDSSSQTIHVGSNHHVSMYLPPQYQPYNAPSFYLLPCWKDISDLSTNGTCTILKLLQLPKGDVHVLISFVIRKDFTWSVFVLGKEPDKERHILFNGYPMLLSTIVEFQQVYHQLSHCYICIGNDDNKFVSIGKNNKGRFVDADGKSVGDRHVCSKDKRVVCNTIHHNRCHLLTQDKEWCDQCAKYRVLLRVTVNRFERNTNNDKTSASGHVNFRYLNNPERKRPKQK